MSDQGFNYIGAIENGVVFLVPAHEVQPCHPGYCGTGRGQKRRQINPLTEGVNFP